MGRVVGLSVGSTLVQDTLRYSLRLRLSGDDAQEASEMSGQFSTLFLTVLRKDCKTCARKPQLFESVGSPHQGGCHTFIRGRTASHFFLHSCYGRLLDVLFFVRQRKGADSPTLMTM